WTGSFRVPPPSALPPDPLTTLLVRMRIKGRRIKSESRATAMVAIPLKQRKVETALIGRGLEGFQRRVEVELQPSGIAELDAVLGGGFPRGSLVELCGPASSGRTSLAFSLLAQATERQEACAFVDVSDSLDPTSLAASGVELPRLLWIRCGEMGDREP